MVQALRNKEKSSSISIHEETAIVSVDWSPEEGIFHVTMENTQQEVFEASYHRIMLATGVENNLKRYPALLPLEKELPIDLVGGLPVLNDEDLSWGSHRCSNTQNNDEEAQWKQTLRRRCYIMGCLAAHTLGPDAVNLLGSRHGAVKVATALRRDLSEPNENENSQNV